MSVPRGHFVLHSSVMPPMTAGAYQLVTDQSELPFEVATERTHVTVAAPRYTMPTDQILSSFPPANGEGAFGDRLPQIVLKRRTLPWERNPAGGTGTSETPWLALVVVAEGEAELSAATPVAQCVTPGTALVDPADTDVQQSVYLAVTETVVAKIFPCADDLPLLVHVREVDVTDTELAGGDDDGWLAVVLANRLPVFDKAAGRSVRYMACLVNVEGQLDALPPPSPTQDFFTFELAQDWSVLKQVNAGGDTLVMGGVESHKGGIGLPRVSLGDAAAGDPAGGARASKPAAHRSTTPAMNRLDGSSQSTAAVSQQWSTAKPGPDRGPRAAIADAALDPDAQVKVRDQMGRGFRYPIELFAAERVLRFPVLAHWSFTTSEGATFETLMQDLDVGLLGTAATPTPDAPPGPPPPEVVETGHVGLGHRTRRGDAVRAWYRGPLVPYPTTRDTPVDGALPVAHAADQLRRVVPDGREDLSLAAAFEIGRLLGLNQLSVVSALTRFRAEQFGLGRVHTVVDQVFAAELGELVERFDFGRFVAFSLLDELARQPEQMLGPRRPIADPGREVRVRGDLDELIAAGLGIDIEAVRKSERAIGIVAALAQTEVPVAFPAGDVELDQAAVAGLRETLATEVERVVDIARPAARRRAAPPEGPADGAPSAAAVPDALDELIDQAERRIEREEDA